MGNSAPGVACTLLAAMLLLSRGGVAQGFVTDPTQIEWGSDAPDIIEPGSCAQDWFIDHFAWCPVQTIDGGVAKWQFTHHDDENGDPQLVVEVCINCGDDETPGNERYTIPVFFFRNTDGATNALGLTSLGGGAIAFSMDYLSCLGTDVDDAVNAPAYGESTEAWAKYNAAMAGTLLHEAMHVHMFAELEANGDEDCYDATTQASDGDPVCQEYYANSFEAAQLCKEAKEGAGIQGLGWSTNDQLALKKRADSANRKCEKYKALCLEAQTSAGCTITPPCGAPEQCPGTCTLN